jgi:hypothetical protein
MVRDASARLFIPARKEPTMAVQNQDVLSAGERGSQVPGTADPAPAFHPAEHFNVVVECEGLVATIVHDYDLWTATSRGADTGNGGVALGLVVPDRDEDGDHNE